MTARKNAKPLTLAERYEALVDKYAALSVKYLALAERISTGAASSPSTLPEAPKRERSVIDAVIRLEAKGNQGLLRYLRDRAKTLRDEHPLWTEAQIATELSRWETAEEMAPEFLVGPQGLTPNEQVN